MPSSNQLRLQFIVFALVSASFTNIYITQPVLPVLQSEFAADAVSVSYSVAAVILGIALANLPFGALVDRWPIRPIILTGALAVAAADVAEQKVKIMSDYRKCLGKYGKTAPERCEGLRKAAESL